MEKEYLLLYVLLYLLFYFNKLKLCSARANFIEWCMSNI